MPKGVTLIEILIIVLIIGIVASIGLINFGKTKENALDREAQASLRLIQAAEKIYSVEADIGNYFPCNNTGEVNGNLKLSLPAAGTNWQYKVDITAGNFTAKAKASSDGRRWCIGANDINPYSNTTDPGNCIAW